MSRNPGDVLDVNRSLRSIDPLSHASHVPGYLFDLTTHAYISHKACRTGGRMVDLQRPWSQLKGSTIRARYDHSVIVDAYPRLCVMQKTLLGIIANSKKPVSSVLP